MDTIASNNVATHTDLTVAKPMRPTQTRSVSDSQPKVETPEPTMPRVSAADVAANAEADKAKSLNALASVAESIEEAVEVLNEALSRKHTSAQIRRDEQLNRFLVTIKDKDSGEVVREVPPEALLKFARNLEELKGILFDETL